MPPTGARLGVPEKFATKTTPGPNGTRWSSEQGQLQIETFRIDTGATIEGVFEQQKKLPRRRIESSALQGDSFVIRGMQGLKKMVVRGFARNGEVRGLTILYDQAMEGSIDPLVAPMTSAYVPFPSFSVASASGQPRRKVEYGTGIFVSSAGHVLTDRRLVEGCNVIALPGLGNAERLAVEANGELALLRVYGASSTPIEWAGAPVGGDLTLLGIADPQAQGGEAAITAVPARAGAAADALETAPAPGFTGAAALDAQGRFAGLVVTKPSLVAGPAGAPQAIIVPVERIRSFLVTNYLTPRLRQARRRRGQGRGDAGDLREELDAMSSPATLRIGHVSRARRSTKWCAADPGPRFEASIKATGVPDQRCTVPLRFTLHRVRDTMPCKSPVLELRRPLLDERRHAFLLVFRREQRVEHAALEQHAFGERRLERAVDRLLGRKHRRQ